jgi:replicative DNA helicase
MNIQHACISLIVLDGELQPFIDAKINEQFFPENEHRRVFEMIMQHYRRQGKPPSEAAVHKAYPNYVFEVPPEPVAYYLEQLQENRKQRIMIDGVQKAADRLTDNAPGLTLGSDLEVILRQTLAQALHEIPQGVSSAYYEEIEARIIKALHERLANPSSMKGISTGIPGIDYVTRGLQKQQLITVVGTPKTGKSSVLLYMAYRASIDAFKTLFFTFEMTNEEQEDRMTSLITQVDLNKILRADYKKDMKKMEQALRAHIALGDRLVFVNQSGMTLSGVQSIIQEQQPDVVFIDGVYLMMDESNPPEPEGSPRMLTNLTRGLKRMAQQLKVPIVISTQALLAKSKGGLTMGSVGYSSSFAQDSDVLFGVEQLEQSINTSKFSVLAQRSGPRKDCYLCIDWTQGSISEVSKEEAESQAGGSSRVGTRPGVLDIDDDEFVVSTHRGDPKRQKKGA